ncbi:I78 family peptidase inhibitor [Modicisalibacter sp. 'Wilcox']|uniref:I78 family peptidase inhibitor n=1 Tax=Modicisalibacter sp. 'Wilcox' TaxID=2679914 RepID=UPI0013D351E5|nr:I78 family peptidase inhibitor [Modicisalibacter sp. 'Wilcox']
MHRGTTLGILVAGLLSGCAGSPSHEPAPAPPPPPMSQADEGACDADALADWTGRDYRDAMTTRARERSGAERVRVIRPGQGYTMDYRPDRLNLHLDEHGRLVGADCG